MTVALAGLVAGFVHVCLGPITWQGLRRTPWTDRRVPGGPASAGELATARGPRRRSSRAV
jgi:hypothetical protein